jgi:hypothetical protein
MYDVTHHFPLAHGSQFISEDFFFSRLPPFFLLTLSYVLLKRGRLRCGGG